MRERRPRPKGQKNQGCLIAVLILVGLIVVCMVVAGVVVYRLSQDPEVRKVFTAAREGLSVYVEARSAPGTEQMRSLGCRQAMAVDLKRLSLLINEARDDEEAPVDIEDVASPFLYCIVGWRSELTCEQLTQAYVRAVPTAPEKMLVQIMVEKLPEAEQRCAGTYSRAGEMLEPLEADDLPEGLPKPQQTGMPAE